MTIVLPSPIVEGTQAAEHALQLIVFKIGNEEFAFGLTDVCEIINTVQLTDVPNAPSIIRGIANLRGKIVTVVDVSRILGLPEAKEGTEKQHIILVESGKELFGMLVDSVTGVLRTSEAHLQPTPDILHSKISSSSVEGVVVLNNVEGTPERMILLLQPARLLTAVSSSVS